MPSARTGHAPVRRVMFGGSVSAIARPDRLFPEANHRGPIREAAGHARLQTASALALSALPCNLAGESS
jgi:hypothetical protein